MKVVALFLVLLVAGCATPNTQRVSVSDSATKEEAGRQMDMAAQDMMDELKRLRRVYRQLSTKAYALCGERIGPDIGAFVMTKPKGDMGNALSRLYGIKDQTTVAFTLAGGPAEKAGVHPRDVVLSINGVSTNDKTALEELSEKISPDDPIVVAVNRAGVAMTFTIKPERGCRYSVGLLPDQIINAFADGKRILVARGMMSFAKDDNELALVLSHELAHNTMKHMDAKMQNMGVGLLADIAVLVLTRGRTSNTNFSQIGATAYSQEFEAEADYVGLYVMASAGLPIADAPKFWRRMAAAHPASIKTNHSASHPSTAYRMVALEETVKEINRKLARKEPLTPNMKDGMLASKPRALQPVAPSAPPPKVATRSNLPTAVATERSALASNSVATPQAPPTAPTNSSITNVVIDLPDGWKSKPVTDAQRADGAVLAAMNPTTNTNMVLFVKKREGIAEMEAFAKSWWPKEVGRLTNWYRSEMVPVKVNGLPALRFTITGMGDVRYTYLQTVLDSGPDILFLSAWTTAAAFQEQRAAMEKLADLLQ